MYKLIKPLLFLMDPEDAHNLAIAALANRFFSKFIIPTRCNDPILKQKIWDLDFFNPVGLAAGFDKNADTLCSIFKFGFGFIECGTVTPRPQIGNKKPRLLRIEKKEAIVNSMGFNNKGISHLTKAISSYKKRAQEIIGINVGKNKDTVNFLDDYIFAINKVYELADYIVLNISSPNTSGLRKLQHNDNFIELIKAVKDKQKELSEKYSVYKPVLIKIAPDNTHAALAKIAEQILAHDVDGIIISNTTINKNELYDISLPEHGGISGHPLFKRSTEVLTEFYRLTSGKIPIIGAGGIMTPEDAYQKILHGASLVQIYTGIIYNGFSLVPKIQKYIAHRLKKDGFSNIKDAVGSSIKTI